MVPVFSGPRDERPPTMYGHFSEVPIDFQRICTLDQRTPTERGRGQFLLLLFSHTDLLFFLQNKQHFIVVYDIFKDGVAHFVHSQHAQCMLGVFFFVESQETASNPCEFNPQVFLHSVLHFVR